MVKVKQWKVYVFISLRLRMPFAHASLKRFLTLKPIPANLRVDMLLDSTKGDTDYVSNIGHVIAAVLERWIWNVNGVQ